MHFRKYFYGTVLLVVYGCCMQSNAAIVMPEPPPELSDTLLDYRTKVQLNDTKAQGSDGLVYNLNTNEVKIVSGDLESGIKRFYTNYNPGSGIILPQFGSAVLRFFDINERPWDIQSFNFQNQGFEAQVSALASELVITQTSGASASQLKVQLEGLITPLVFKVQATRLVNESNNLVRTTLNSIKLNYYKDLKDYVKPKIHTFSVPNPLAQKIDYSEVNQDKLLENLIKAVEQNDKVN